MLHARENKKFRINYYIFNYIKILSIHLIIVTHNLRYFRDYMKFLYFESSRGERHKDNFHSKFESQVELRYLGIVAKNSIAVTKTGKNTCPCVRHATYVIIATRENTYVCDWRLPRRFSGWVTSRGGNTRTRRRVYPEGGVGVQGRGRIRGGARWGEERGGTG